MKIHKTKINYCLKFVIFLGSAALFNSPTYAETDITGAENSILSLVVGDWNGDKQIDSAVLVRSSDQADLYLYLGNDKGDMTLKSTKKGLINLH